MGKAASRQPNRTSDSATPIVADHSHPNKPDLAEYCGKLIAAGINHKDIIRAILSGIAGNAVADETWLPTASIINLSDSLVHVPLQKDENKQHVMVFRERRPPFKRIEVPPRAVGSVPELKARFEEAMLGNDWQLGERWTSTSDDFGPMTVTA